MMVSPGVSVLVNFPRRSMIHSSPCGTILTPFHTVTIVKISNAMTTISNPIAHLFLGSANFEYVALDLKHLNAFPGLDFLVRDRLPHFVPQHRFLEPDLSFFEGTDVADNESNLPDHRALGHARASLVKTRLEYLEPKP